ncbi:MAG: DUF6434 domain-containing protein [Pseudomonadales bacterium]
MPRNSPSRPGIHTINNGAELRRWYWLKSELSAEARRLGVPSSGAKFTILERLCHYHDTGERQRPEQVTAKPSSRFDWHAADLSMQTIVTDNYRNTQNVRRFFQRELNPAFKFNLALLDWFRQNVGSTLGDAAAFWKDQQTASIQTKIKPHNQFNQYTRDFLKDNPALGMQDVREVWALKKQLPSDTGRHVYEPSDLELRTKS